MNDAAASALAAAEAEAAGTPASVAGSDDRMNLANRLRAQTCGVSIRHEKFGVRKALNREQVKTAAAGFHAESSLLAATKRLIDTRDPAYRAVTKCRSQASQLFKGMTTPYPEPGTRLIRRENVPLLNAQLTAIKAQLDEAVIALQAKYEELREHAKEKLGDLFNEEDYPPRIDDQFDLEWFFPNLDPPAYLKNLNPVLYEQEVARVQARFSEAVAMTEQAFVAKLAELVTHLGERLVGDVDGKPKVFKDSSIENLKAFFEDFRKLDIGNGGQLAAIVDQAQNVVKGIVKPDELRGNLDLRKRVAEQLGSIQTQIESMMINTPKRAIDLDDEEGSAAA